MNSARAIRSYLASEAISKTIGLGELETLIETAARISTDELLELAIQSEVEARIAADIAVLEAAEARIAAMLNAAEARIAEVSSERTADRVANLQHVSVVDNTVRVVSLEEQWNNDPIIGATKVTDKLGNVIQHVNYNDGTTEDKVARVKDINTIADRVADNTSRIQSLESAVFTNSAQ